MSESSAIRFTVGEEAFSSASSDELLRLQLSAFADRVDYHLQTTLMAELTTRYAKVSALLDQRSQELSQSNAVRKEAQQLAQLGNWRVDLITQTLTWSDTMFDLLGMDPLSKPNLSCFMQRLHPDDLPQVQQITDALMLGLVPDDLVYRLVKPDGQVRWVQARHV